MANVKPGRPPYKAVNPIIYSSNGLGVRNAAQDELVAHRSHGISQPKVERSNGTSGPGSTAPGSTVNLNGSSV